MTKTTIIINSKDKTIEVTKAFAKAASVFGSPEYRMLQEARRDNAKFEVKVMQSRKKHNFTGLTKETMRNYIAKHDDAEGSKMMEFRTLLGEVDADAEDEHRADEGKIRHHCVRHEMLAEQSRKDSYRALVYPHRESREHDSHTERRREHHCRHEVEYGF